MANTFCGQLVSKLIDSDIELTKTQPQASTAIDIGFTIGADVSTAGQERTDIHIQGVSPFEGADILGSTAFLRSFDQGPSKLLPSIAMAQALVKTRDLNQPRTSAEP